MTQFFVGQRVRIVGSGKYDLYTSLVGKEGTVAGFWAGRGEASGEYRNDWVCVDVDGGSYPDSICRPYELEPLTDSYNLVGWESMRDLWVPEHLREAA